ncbi:hypothetical protein [Paraburkholderia terrae]
MNIPLPIIAAATVQDDSAIWFSAYGFGWGYCVFEIRPLIMQTHLGAADTSPQQLLLAFVLSKRAVLQAIGNKSLPATGERITLLGHDFC